MKKNQIMITALALMIAVAGYLNFTGNPFKEKNQVVINDQVTVEDDGLSAMLDISSEDIESLDSEAYYTDNYSDSTLSETMEDSSPVSADVAEVSIPNDQEDIPGEAVFTSTQVISTLSQAKLLKEQTRGKNKESLLAIMDQAGLEESQKQEAVNSMIALTNLSEKEMEAEILLASKGFENAVVSIGENSVDVVVAASALTDTQLAQIMDIVTRKAGVGNDQVIISQVADK